MREYWRNYYRSNVDKSKHNANRKASKDKRRAFLIALKDKPCTDCRQRYNFWQMQWDHVRGTKLFDVSRAATGRWTEAQILSEIEKCELVCANCHADRTYMRRLAR